MYFNASGIDEADLKKGMRALVEGVSNPVPVMLEDGYIGEYDCVSLVGFMEVDQQGNVGEFSYSHSNEAARVREHEDDYEVVPRMHTCKDGSRAVSGLFIEKKKEVEKMFDAKKVAEDVTVWTRNWVNKTIGDDVKVVIGISGGKDSTVVAKILVDALGKERVIGVLMPNGVQADIADSQEVVRFLGIPNYTVNIGEAYNGLTAAIETAMDGRIEVNGYKTNTPARLRMTVLFGISAIIGKSVVVNTCNWSETYIGWETYGGDGFGCFAPIGHLTKTEVVALGDALGLPEHLVHKTPSDGMCGSSDEEAMGFTYDELDEYIRKGIEGEHIKRIKALHRASQFKRNNLNLPTFELD